MHNPVGYRITPPVATLNIHPIANAVSEWDANDSKYDLFKDSEGKIIVKPKSGVGPGEDTGLNILDFKGGVR